MQRGLLFLGELTNRESEEMQEAVGLPAVNLHIDSGYQM